MRVSPFYFKKLLWVIIIFLPISLFFINIPTVASSNYDENVAHYFYYNQLNTVEREIYHVLQNSKEAFIANQDIFCVTGPSDKKEEYLQYIQRAIFAYSYDNPETSLYFYHYKYKTFALNSTLQSNCYDYILHPGLENNQYTFFSSAEVQTMLNDVETTTREFVKTLTGKDAKKLRMIYDWLYEDAVYDASASLPNNTNIYGAIIEKNAVCSGYALAFKYIADMAGIDTIYVTGYLDDLNLDYHAWNLSYLDEWLFVDITMDITFNKNRHTFFLLSDDIKKMVLAEFDLTYFYNEKDFVYPE